MLAYRLPAAVYGGYSTDRAYKEQRRIPCV